MKSVLLLMLALLLAALTAQGQDKPLPNTVFFTGASADPNGTVYDVSGDIGGAKLVASGTYLGAVAHVSKGAPPVRVSTKLQFHIAQRLLTFRSCPFFWTGEVGPDVIVSQAVATSGTSQGLPSQTAAMSVGFSAGSGPLLSIPLGHATYLMPHAEITKGSMQDLGWRGGILIGFGSN